MIIYDTRADRLSFNVIKKWSLGFGHKLQDTGDAAEQKQTLQGGGETTRLRWDRAGGMNQDNQDNQDNQIEDRRRKVKPIRGTI